MIKREFLLYKLYYLDLTHDSNNNSKFKTDLYY